MIVNPFIIAASLAKASSHQEDLLRLEEQIKTIETRFEELFPTGTYKNSKIKVLSGKCIVKGETVTCNPENTLATLKELEQSLNKINSELKDTSGIIKNDLLEKSNAILTRIHKEQERLQKISSIKEAAEKSQHFTVINESQTFNTKQIKELLDRLNAKEKISKESLDRSL